MWEPPDAVPTFGLANHPVMTSRASAASKEMEHFVTRDNDRFTLCLNPTVPCVSLKNHLSPPYLLVSKREPQWQNLNLGLGWSWGFRPWKFLQSPKIVRNAALLPVFNP